VRRRRKGIGGNRIKCECQGAQCDQEPHDPSTYHGPAALVRADY
jgi:hypothetical protein